jgi:DNA-directed RNA polymerase subunit RPC12/RpoP
MKLAVNECGDLIEAKDGAPKNAHCPHCKGVVVLRSRRNGYKPEKVTYFWRHLDYTNPDCGARIEAVNYQKRLR